MTETELEERIRAARLNDTEIAPLNPARSSAILARALEKTRRPNRNRGMLLPIFSPAFRVAVASVAAGAAGIFISISSPLVEQGTILPDEATLVSHSAIIRPASEHHLENHSETNSHSILIAKKPDEGPSGKPLQPTRREKTSPKRQRSQPRKSNPLYRVPSITIPSKLPESIIATKPVRQAPGTNPVPKATAPTSDARQEADGPLFVAASGVPVGDDTAELRVAVRKNVAPEEPGRAEAAAVQTVADRNSQSLMDYWVHAQIASGAEPTLTLTALR